MNRFIKLNQDIQNLAVKLLEDVDVRKLIYYPDAQLVDKPDVEIDDILHKRLLLFTSKLPLAVEKCTYVMIRPFRFRPSDGGQFVITYLCFDIYVHQDIRRVVFEDNNGEILSGDRVLLLMGMIDSFMSKGVNFNVGRENLDGSTEIDSRNAEYAGYTLAYRDVDFR